EAGAANDSLRFVQAKRGFELPVAGTKRFAQRYRIFERNACSLRQILQHRVSGTAERRRAAVTPAVDRIAVGRRPALPRRRFVEQLAWPVTDLGEVRHHLVARSFAHAPLLLLAAVKSDHDVVLLAPAQRVMNEMAIRTHPDRRGVPPQVGGHIGVWDQRAIDDMPRDAMPVADQMLPDDRVHAVAAHDRRAFVDNAACVGKTHLFIVDFDFRDTGGRVNAYVFYELDFFVQRLMDVGAVDNRVRIVEAAAKRLADGNARDFAAVDRIHHDELIGEYRTAPRTLADTERVHGGKAVGAELQPGADLADFRGLLKNFDAETLLAQRQCGGHAPNAAADDQHRLTMKTSAHRALQLNAVRKCGACAATAIRRLRRDTRVRGSSDSRAELSQSPVHKKCPPGGKRWRCRSPALRPCLRPHGKRAQPTRAPDRLRRRDATGAPRTLAC